MSLGWPIKKTLSVCCRRHFFTIIIVETFSFIVDNFILGFTQSTSIFTHLTSDMARTAAVAAKLLIFILFEVCPTNVLIELNYLAVCSNSRLLLKKTQEKNTFSWKWHQELSQNCILTASLTLTFSICSREQQLISTALQVSLLR